MLLSFHYSLIGNSKPVSGTAVSLIGGQFPAPGLSPFLIHVRYWFCARVPTGGARIQYGKSNFFKLNMCLQIKKPLVFQAAQRECRCSNFLKFSIKLFYSTREKSVSSLLLLSSSVTSSSYTSQVSSGVSRAFVDKKCSISKRFFLS